MVVITQAAPVQIPVVNVVNNELKLNSSRCIRFVAPTEVELESALEALPTIKRGDHDQLNDSWQGVADMCQAIDDFMENEKDNDLLIHKSVLEIGFTTGLPSLLALDSGAADVTVHSLDKLSSELFIAPTFKRNQISQTLYKYECGDLTSCLTNLATKKFDVILAPELTASDEELFPLLHDILDAALSPNGIILLSARPFYEHCSGSIQGFLDLVKHRGCFDAHVRWTSPKSELAPRQLIQLTRSIR